MAKLVKASEIKRFKIWVYQWTDLKEKAEAEKVCSTLLQHLSLKTCEPDYQLKLTVYNYISAVEKEVENARSGVKNARKAVEVARRVLAETEARADRVLAQITKDRGLAIEEERVRRAEAALVTAKRRLEQVLQSGKDPKIARWNVNHLKKLVVSRKQRVENRKKWFAGTKKYVTDNQNKLVAARRATLQRAESWLENRLQYLSRSERRLADARTKYGNRNNNKEKKHTQPPTSPNRTNKNVNSNTRSSSSPGAASHSNSNGQNADLKTCNIVSSQLRLPNPDGPNTLTDYWAQEMVGADLLKEEVEKAGPIKKKLVEAFDICHSGHASKVRNIISHQGSHSVLPELGNNIGVSHVRYISDILTASDRLLNRADEVCGTSNADR